ncbi:uncharacterized protein EV420DRAFT_1211735 [Desarmillaria tabescens]|uniref:Uncharacterized protein n=1 Tax=Armillaria tabescens TaxID=1929756 RepID=A0AA39J8Y7_ARMTA|nr:uncharacterized protein EV420DRAFT_1211735 [Desarmillaria tabescens]KAK0438337.1 hypothetical protein EV420DRAFT_1211735 [Desarmillaria tabescens]
MEDDLTDSLEGQESQDRGESSSSSGQELEKSESGQELTESSVKSGQESENLDLGRQSFTPESGQGPPESISEQELEESSSNSGRELEKQDLEQQSFKEPQQEPKESSSELFDGESSLNARQGQEDLDLDFELTEPSSERDFKEARSNSGQEKHEESEEPNESVPEPSPIPESNDSGEILSLCKALEAFRIPPPCSSFHASLGKAHFIAAGGSKRTAGSNNVASSSTQERTFTRVCSTPR